MMDDRLIENFKFWVDQEVIYCQILNDLTDLDDDNKIKDIEHIFLNKIFMLSKDVHMPILIDLKELNFSNAIKVFKFLSKNTLIKSLVLSKTFLVNSYKLKILLNIQSFICNPALPDVIFKCNKSAIQYCIDDNRTYNSLN
ncbi:MAG: hypothetical protein ACI9NI_000369 [Olleya marilimosa]|jgi:hypothetical protein|uniref:hypothetical protein n=1 Tax=Olleya marilimosa TaxID=272164 RepID=UPI0030ED07A5|tara:strand:- start:244887 stop:245309 length:423 start_codon:yes stop_codon:yes gene_type:complete